MRRPIGASQASLHLWRVGVGSRAARLRSPLRLVAVAALKTLHGEIAAARQQATRD
jgi:hypothetical protein